MPSDQLHKRAQNGADTAVERPPLPPVLMDRVGFLLAMTKGGAENIVSKALEEIGIYPRQYGLMLVLASEGPLSQGELAEWVRTDRTTMVALVDGLEERGYVRRERNPADRRAYRLQLTAEGKRALPRCRAVMRRAENQLLRSLDSEERAQLIELLGKVAVDVGQPPGDTIDNVPRR
jgi:MarR family transcriptional regulator, lower aerobic nicotinate degradation pathway regulator